MHSWLAMKLVDVSGQAANALIGAKHASCCPRSELCQELHTRPRTKIALPSRRCRSEEQPGRFPTHTCFGVPPFCLLQRCGCCVPWGASCHTMASESHSIWREGPPLLLTQTACALPELNLGTIEALVAIHHETIRHEIADLIGRLKNTIRHRPILVGIAWIAAPQLNL